MKPSKPPRSHQTRCKIDDEFVATIYQQSQPDLDIRELWVVRLPFPVGLVPTKRSRRMGARGEFSP